MKGNKLDKMDSIKKEVKALESKRNHIANAGKISIIIDGNLSVSPNICHKLLNTVKRDVMDEIDSSIKELNAQYQELLVSGNKIKTYEQLKSFIGSPILMGYHSYPNDCYAWMGVLRQIGSDKEQSYLEEVVRELKHDVGSDYITYLDLHTHNTVEMYDGRRGLIPAVEDVFEEFSDEEYTCGTDADWIRIPTNEELENYYKKVEIITNLPPAWRM